MNGIGNLRFQGAAGERDEAEREQGKNIQAHQGLGRKEGRCRDYPTRMVNPA
jgi:hypothetical protein